MEDQKPKITILGVAASPRRGGNTDLLVREALRGADDAGGEVEFLAIRDHTFRPCIECGRCRATGQCAMSDGMGPLYEKLIATDRLVFASPVFFVAVSAYAKALIDRCQCFWSLRYVLRKPLFDPPRPERRALFLSCCGWRESSMFDGARRTVRAFFDVLEFRPAGELCYPGIDAKGDILKHPTALTNAYQAGRSLVCGPTGTQP